MRILVTGGEGVVASYIKEIFLDDEVLLMGKNELDITQIKNIENIVSMVQPDCIIHLAAITNVDYCQSHEKEAMQVNYHGTENIAIIARRFNISLVFVSTASVFNGKKKFSNEEDNPSPVNIYAKSKFLGEQVIQKLLKDFLIIRAGWVIGGKKKFISYIIDDIKAGKNVRAVNDKFGSIVYVPDLLNFIKEKLENEQYGLYHFGSCGIPSRYEIACFLNELFGNKAKILSVSSKEFEEDFPAPRLRYEVLKSKYGKFKTEWKEAVKQYVNESYAL